MPEPRIVDPRVAKPKIRTQIDDGTVVARIYEAF